MLGPSKHRDKASFELDLVEFEFESKHLRHNGGEGGEDHHLGDIIDQGVGGEAGDLEWTLQFLKQRMAS